MGVRVLLVEDDRAIREALLEALGDAGYEVATAIDGKDALNRLRLLAPPQVLLLDLMMPRMSGRELANEVRRLPELAKVPIVVVSADTQAPAKAKAIGAAACLTKPVRLGPLFNTLSSVVANVGT